MASIIIIYGSTSGNTEMVSYKVTQVLESKGHKVTIKRAELSSPADIKGHDLCILGASTYGHGIIQNYMIPFIAEMKKGNFKGQNFAVIGLGDTKYDAHYNIESAIILENTIKETHGNLIHKSLMINKNPIWQMNKVTEWAESLATTLKSK